MKYLVIGDANSMHIYNFVNTVLLPRGYEIHLLTLSSSPLRESYQQFYDEKGVKVHAIANKGYKGLEKKDQFSRMKQFLWKLKLLKDVPQVDVCHVHSVYKTALVMVLQNRKKFKKLILSYWGGDIEDRTPAVVKLREKVFRFADAITVTVKQTYNEFHRIYGSEFDSKLSVCRFATDGLNCIKNLAENTTRQECRAAYNIPRDKLCVTCGYNAQAAQHQDISLQFLMLQPDHIREKLFVIVPMQYGRHQEGYIERVRQIAAQCDFTCTILEEFVPQAESAKLAIATDVFVHIRRSDAFSNSLKEHIYAGSKVIIGDWLKYPELEEMGAPVISVKAMGLLDQALTQVLENTVIQDTITLFDPIYELYSTEEIVKQWGNVIDKVL